MRIVQIISTSLVKDKLVQEEMLEKTINGDLPMDEKELKIKEILRNICAIENMTNKWVEYIPKPEIKTQE